MNGAQSTVWTAPKCIAALHVTHLSRFSNPIRVVSHDISTLHKNATSDKSKCEEVFQELYSLYESLAGRTSVDFLLAPPIRYSSRWAQRAPPLTEATKGLYDKSEKRKGTLGRKPRAGQEAEERGTAQCLTIGIIYNRKGLQAIPVYQLVAEIPKIASVYCYQLRWFTICQEACENSSKKIYKISEKNLWINDFCKKFWIGEPPGLYYGK